MIASSASRAFSVSSSRVRSSTFSSSDEFSVASSAFFAPQLAQQLCALALEAEARQEVLDREPQIGLVPRLGDVLVEAGAVDRVDDRVEAGLAGEQDLHRLRAAPVDLLEQLDALHARHDLVGDHDRELLAVLLQIVDQLERLARVLRDRDVALVAEARRQLLAQRREDPLLVVDAEDVLAQRTCLRRHAGPSRHRLRPAGGPAPRPRRPTAAASTGSATGRPSIGSRTSKRVRPGLAVDANRPAVLLDDARGDATGRGRSPRPSPWS